MRAILFAKATAATIFGLRATSAASQRLALPPLRTTQRITLMAPTISNRRMSVCPILLTDPSLAFPPVDLCRGTKPSQAAKLRPLSNVSRSGANAATAPAVTGPIFFRYCTGEHRTTAVELWITAGPMRTSGTEKRTSGTKIRGIRNLEYVIIKPFQDIMPISEDLNTDSNTYKHHLQQN